MSVTEEEEHLQTPHPQKKPRIGYIIFSAVLLTLLLGGSLFFLLRSRNSPAGPIANRVRPTPTPTAIPTDTPPPQSLFFDTFADNSHGWSLSNNAGDTGYMRTIANNMLTLTDTNPKTTLIESVPTGMYDDCVVSVDFTIVTASLGDSVGIYVRGDSNLDHDYRIEINGDNTFDIAKEYLDANDDPQASTLDGPRSASSIRPLGQPNTVTVIMKGPTLVVLINNTKVSTINDSDYTSGQIALFAHADTTSGGVSASFSRMEIDRVPE